MLVPVRLEKVVQHTQSVLHNLTHRLIGGDRVKSGTGASGENNSFHAKLCLSWTIGCTSAISKLAAFGLHNSSYISLF